MTNQIDPDGKRKPEEPNPSALVIDSSALLKGQRELIVRHADFALSPAPHRIEQADHDQVIGSRSL